MASTSLSHRSPMNKGELPCRGGGVETPDRASLQFVPSGIRSVGEKIFLQAGTGFGLAQLKRMEHLWHRPLCQELVL